MPGCWQMQNALLHCSTSFHAKSRNSLMVFHFPLKIENLHRMPFFGSLDFIKKIMSIQTEQTLPTHTPFLTSNSNQSHQHQPQENNNDEETQTPLDDVPASLEALLTLLGFNQSSLLSFTVSWTTFPVVGVVASLLALQVYDTDKNQIKGFEIGIVAFQTCLAAVSLICLSQSSKILPHQVPLR